MSILICLVSIKAYSLYAPFREDEDDYLQEVTQWQLFMVLFSSILTRVDTTDDSVADQTYLGWLLIAFVVPGYVTMAWECVKSYLEVFYKAVDEAEKAKGEVTELDATCGGCLGMGSGGAVAAAGSAGGDEPDGPSPKRAPQRQSSQAQLQEMLDGGSIELKLLNDAEDRAANLDAANDLALKFFRKKDYTLAHKCLEVGADEGHHKSVYGLGLLYRYGLGVTKDLSRARGYFDQAQSLGSDLATSELAKMDEALGNDGLEEQVAVVLADSLQDIEVELELELEPENVRQPRSGVAQFLSLFGDDMVQLLGADDEAQEGVTGISLVPEPSMRVPTTAAEVSSAKGFAL